MATEAVLGINIAEQLSSVTERCRILSTSERSTGHSKSETTEAYFCGEANVEDMRSQISIDIASTLEPATSEASPANAADFSVVEVTKASSSFLENDLETETSDGITPVSWPTTSKGNGIKGIQNEQNCRRRKIFHDYAATAPINSEESFPVPQPKSAAEATAFSTAAETQISITNHFAVLSYLGIQKNPDVHALRVALIEHDSLRFDAEQMATVASTLERRTRNARRAGRITCQMADDWDKQVNAMFVAVKTVVTLANQWHRWKGGNGQFEFLAVSKIEDFLDEASNQSKISAMSIMGHERAVPLTNNDGKPSEAVHIAEVLVATVDRDDEVKSLRPYIAGFVNQYRQKRIFTNGGN
ncbi:hypothetical protein HDU97_002742 [Phlyctochytrium planicorne]|nr:hypothetical protein HDU97_004940 [Phlyctochytrium planicorne]KAJ3099816.1 hypothetical protein HDU97_002742 [Phlyctochytrium planicorne]